jgi:hypothetical protein
MGSLDAYEDDALESAMASRRKSDVGCFMVRSGCHKPLKTW